MPNIVRGFSIFQRIFGWIRRFFSLKPSAIVGESSSKYELITINRFGGVCEQTDKKTHWHPIALVRRYDNPFNLFEVCIILPDLFIVSRPEELRGSWILFALESYNVQVFLTKTSILMWSHLFYPNLYLLNIDCKYLAWWLKYRRDLKIAFWKHF